MFIEEWRESFVLPSKFHEETIVDGAKINYASIEKIAECMKGSAKIHIGEEINHNSSKDSTTKLIVDCPLCTEIITNHHNVAIIENGHISNFSLDGGAKKVSSGAALDDLGVAAMKDNDNNSKDSDELELGQKPFPVNLIDFQNKKVLVHAHQTEST
jgi:Zn finger protein HypA/HybF involved in hydrogenase expression